ncbi:MAG TPA: endonuclease/exonuclease/phosphatase family protein [Actinomycetota bacterium]|nr:endonuclease/exonuclease/phosphatase family protein [Actinomycetota bacterium]
MPQLEVATFNVHHCEGLDGRIDLARIADVITRTGASIVALQELDELMERTGRVDQPAELSRLTGLHIGFVPTLRRGEGSYGIGLASKEKLVWRPHQLPLVGDEEPRAAIVATMPGVTIVAAHLSLQPGPLATQTAAVAELVRDLDGPIVVLGDLNQPRRTLTPLFDAGLDSPRWPRKTLVRRFAQRDHILAGHGARVGRRRVVRTRGSDHNALSGLVLL